MSVGKSLNLWLAQVHRVVGEAKYQILHVACQAQGLVPKWLLETAGRIMDLAAQGEKGVQIDSERFCTTDKAFKEGAGWAGASENNGLLPQMKLFFVLCLSLDTPAFPGPEALASAGLLTPWLQSPAC